MNTVIKHIEFLISRKDCVIIPGIGAILALDIPSRIVSETGFIMPPSRSYSFNSDLSMSDGVLVASIARDQSISFETASRRVEQASESIMNSLRTSGSFILGSLGILHHDNDTHSISFEASESLITSYRTLWLKPVILHELVESQLISQESYPVVIEKSSLFKRAFRIAASIALLIGFCFIASTPVAVQDAALASLAPELRQLSPAEFHPSLTNDQLTIISPPQKSSETPIKIADLGEVKLKEYMIVVGTLRNMDEAKIFCDKYSDLNLHIYPYGKYVKIYTEAFSTREEAVTCWRKTHTLFPDAWIYKK